ncbi:MAG TPA: extracellular solute-binding protein [Acidimicrobiales bacterium]|nr:extracellular solute-binding protein [Acidimicrobiales bacterium]
MTRALRRRAALAALAATTVASLACSDPPTSGGGVVVDGNGDVELPDCPLDALDEAAASGPVPVTLWYGGLTGKAKDAMVAQVANFNAAQDVVELKADDQGVDYDEVYRKFTSAASADTSQLPDVVYLEDVQLRALADSGLVLPAEACMEAADYDMTEIEPAARAKYSVDDVLYPGYMNISTPVLYYNKAHWAKAGLDPEDPPDTLDEVYEVARALKAAGVSPRPMSFKADRWFFESWLTGVDVDIVNEDNGRSAEPTEATFDTPEARDLMAWLTKMDDEGLLNPFADTEGSIDHYLALITQDSSMLIETSTASSTIAATVSGTITAAEAGVDFDESVIDKSALVPGAGALPGIEQPGQVFASGGAFYILNTSDAPQQAGAWSFLEFMLQPENAKLWHTGGGYLPAVKAVNDEPDIEAFWTDDLTGVLLFPAVEQLADADPDRPGPLIGPYNDETAAIQGAMESILFDGADIDAALADAEATVTQSLERYAGE